MLTRHIWLTQPNHFKGVYVPVFCRQLGVCRPRVPRVVTCLDNASRQTVSPAAAAAPC